jgi:hypothetical protein
MKWSDFVKQMASVSGSKLDALALAEMLREGSTPSWVGNPRYGCYTEAVIDGAYYRCDYKTQQNYLAIGTDEDWGVYGLTEVSLQAWCDHPYGGGGVWFIPTRKLVKNNWRFSTCKLPLITIDPHPGEVLASGINGFATMQTMVNAAMVKKGCSINAFNRARKAYVCGPSMPGDNLYFYGWFDLDGVPLQNNNHASSPHPAKAYSDYSHGCDIVHHDATVNGTAMGIEDVSVHPKLWPLVSDDGPIVLRFPNKGIAIDTSAAAQVAGLPIPEGYKGPVYKARNGVLQQMSMGSALDEQLVSAGSEDLNPAPIVYGDAASAPSSAWPWIVGLGVASGIGYYLYSRSKK